MAQFKEIDDINFPFEVATIAQRESALKFADYLNSIGIKAIAKPGFGANYSVYVANERDVSKAKLEFLRFGSNPFAKAYNKAAWSQGRKVKRERTINSRPIGFSLGNYYWTPFSLTSVIEIIALLFYILSLVPSFNNMLLSAFAWPWLSLVTSDMQIWRVITPIFLHFGFLHIAFNIVMFEAFARPIERYFGSFKLLYTILVIGIVSNIAQAIVLSGQGVFGGLSGVVYGIIGYMAVLSRREDLPQELKLPAGLFVVSLIFIAFGFFLSGIANLCHLGGILVGVALGFVDYKGKLKYKR